MKRLLGILTISFFLMNFSNAATNNTAESISDEKLDSIIRVKKDSLLEVLNAKIELSANFLKSNKGYINNMHDGLLLLMLNDHFKLGMSKQLPDLEKEKKAYMRLYGKYFNNNTDYKFPKSEENNEDADTDDDGTDSMIINEGFINALNNSYSRNLIVSFCEQVPLHNAYIEYMFKKSMESDTSLISMYAMLAEYNKNKCADAEGISSANQAKMSDNLKILVANIKGGINNKVKALAILQYGGDADVRYMFKNATLLLDSQDKLGFWATDLNNTGDPDGSTTISGLWALCSFRDSLLKLK